MMRYSNSLWWKLAVLYVVISVVLILILNFVISPIQIRHEYQSSMTPAVLKTVITPTLDLIEGHLDDPVVTAKALLIMKKALVNVQDAESGISIADVSSPLTSIGIYDAAGKRVDVLEAPNLALPKEWPNRQERLERQSDEECFLTIPIGEDGMLIVRHYARLDIYKYIMTDYDNSASNIFWLPVIFSVPGIALGLLFTAWISRRLKHMSKVTKAWSSGDFSQQITDKRKDELSVHAELLNHMADDLSAHIKVQQQLNTAEERNRLARELHDSVKQQSFAVGLQLHAAQQWLVRDPQKAASLVQQAASLNQSMQTELVNILQRLKVSTESAPTLQQSMQELAARWSAQVDIHFDIDHAIILSDQIAHEIVRIVSEAFANVVKHANANRCEVSVKHVEKRILLTISDNGRGFDVHQVANGIGLQSIRERTQTLPAGEFELRSSEQGTLLSISWESPGELKS
jgi:two-component system, NarL family, sensor histidine kinase LiaS